MYFMMFPRIRISMTKNTYIKCNVMVSVMFHKTIRMYVKSLIKNIQLLFQLRINIYIFLDSHR
jgi:hypothetical protein